MTAVLATKQARAADTSTFTLQLLDKNGAGVGPYLIAHAVADANGNLIYPRMTLTNGAI